MATRRVHGDREWAERCLRKFAKEAQAQERAFRRSCGQTVGDLIDTCMARGEPTWSPSTVRTQRHLAWSYLAPLRDIPFHELKVEDVSTHYDKLLAGEYTKAALAATTVSRAHEVLHAMLEDAVRWEWIDRNPASRAHVPRGHRPKTVLPKVDDLKASVATIETGDKGFHLDPMWALAIHLAAASGMRQGELCGLQWEDVDFARAELQIQRTVVDGIKGGVSGVYVKDWPKTTRRTQADPRRCGPRAPQGGSRARPVQRPRRRDRAVGPGLHSLGRA